MNGDDQTDQPLPAAKRARNDEPPATPHTANTSNAAVQSAGTIGSPRKLPRGDILNLDSVPTERLKGWLKKNMQDAEKTIPSHPKLLGSEDMQYTLQGRDKAMHQTKILFRDMFLSVRKNVRD